MHLTNGVKSGMDLEGNTFWEFRDRLHPSRPRRIMNFKNKEGNYADYKVVPQWHQWLRSTRIDPPTISELEADVVRMQVLKQRAAIADARWAAKESLLTAPAMKERESNHGGIKRTISPRASIVDTMDPPKPTKVDARPDMVRSEASVPGKTRNAGENLGETIEEDKRKKAIDDPWARAKVPEGGFTPGEWRPGEIRRRGEGES